ncbi:hypothetical protein PBI_SCTP2_16 [Salicola phage SCTP-2]|nr:hypothetical protein PBI_SCTP2_16 [Salicola phage SCTP-2]
MDLFKTSNIEANVPPKLLRGEVQSVSGYGYWSYPNGSNDPWWKDGSQTRYYSWSYNITIEEAQHGSHLTREPFVYNGYDIHVGDYIASNDGTVLKITQVIYKSSTEIDIVAEDYLRYNTFNASDGVGRIDIGACVIFQVNENMQPMFSSIPKDFSSTRFYSRVDSYFKYLNPIENFLLFKTNHGLTKGDIISISNTGEFIKTNDSNSNRIVGHVTQTMGSDWFMINPINDIYDYRPAVEGNAGDFLYSGSNGEITTEKSSKLLFIKLLDAVSTSITGTNANPNFSSGDELLINGESVSTNDGSLQTLSNNINNLNSELYSSDITSSEVTMTVQSGEYNYGLFGGYIPFSAEINGNLIEFNDDSSGSNRYGSGIADEYDIVNTINKANIENIEASVDGSDAILTSLNGNSINIVNVQNDTNDIPFAGTSSITAWPLSKSESTDYKIIISRLDGGKLQFNNPSTNSVNMISELGLYDVHNGRYPVVLYVEQGIRKGDVYIVDDDNQKNNLNVLPGDSAYVMDSGNGEWAYWIYTMSGWSMIANADSAKTDANTLSLTLTSADTQGTYLVGTVSNNSRVSNITISVDQAFDDDKAIIDVGDSGDNKRLIENEIVDLTSVSNYASNPSYVYDNGGDTSLNAYFEPANSTTGSLTVVITYA